MILNGQLPYVQVRANIDAQTAVVGNHLIPGVDGAPARNDVEVTSFIAARPLPTGDFELAKSFVRLKCAGVTEAQIDNAVVYAGEGGYYRFRNLPCAMRVNPLFGAAYTVASPDDLR